MRSKCFKAVMLALFSVGLAAVVESGWAQSLQLVTMNTSWKYNKSGANLGTGWVATGYNDTVAGWEGPGLPLFGFESTPDIYLPYTFNTLFPDPTTVNPYVLTYYFRAHFNMPAYPIAVVTNTTLICSNWVDDGAVIYLNGVELGRGAMPAGAVTSTTLANSISEPGFFSITNLGTNMVVGDNVLAVEVHQVNNTSSDDVFGMTMTVILPAPPAITKQPVGQTNVVGATNVSLSVAATGALPLSYQWYSNNVRIASATGTSFNVVTAKTNTVNYFVTVSNFLGVVTSDVVRVAIVLDTFPPLMVSAIAGPASVPPFTVTSNQVLVFYNELMQTATAGAVSNYAVTLLATTNIIQVTAAQLGTYAVSNVSVVKLTCASDLILGNNYVLTVNRAADTNRIPILPNSQMGIVFGTHLVTNLMRMDQLWRWDENIDDPGTAWKETNYVVPDSWGGPAPGFLYYDQVTGGIPDFPCATNSSPTQFGGYAHWTYYFRTHFNFPTNLPKTGKLVFKHLLDDGAIFYLNGAEIFRFNMCDGTPGPTVDACYPVTNAICVITNVSVTNLVGGDNVLAAELHQYRSDTAGFDIIFGTQVDYDYQLGGAVPPRLKITPNPANPNNLILTWSSPLGLKWGLEARTSLDSGSWVPIANPSPYTNTIIGAKFFRVRLN